MEKQAYCVGHSMILRYTWEMMVEKLHQFIIILMTSNFLNFFFQLGVGEVPTYWYFILIEI